MRSLGRARQAKGRSYYDGDVNLPVFLTAKTLRMAMPRTSEDDPVLVLRLDAILFPVSLKQEGAIRVRMIRGETEIGVGLSSGHRATSADRTRCIAHAGRRNLAYDCLMAIWIRPAQAPPGTRRAA
jgi:hypothetical protein